LELTAELDSYTIEDIQEFMMSEDFEQLDELSKSTLGSYIKKAADDKAFRMHTQQRFAHNQDIVGGERRKYDNRDSGITKAVNRLTGSKISFTDNQGNKKRMHVSSVKEELHLDDYSLEELEDYMMSEDFEQLDELSKKTLGNYIKKSSDQLRQHSAAIASKYMRGDKDAAEFDLSTKRKASNRDAGIKQAIGKLTKEEAEELDELSKGTLGSYIKKASHDASNKSADAAVDLVLPVSRAFRKGHETFYDLDNKASKRQAGISKAVDKLAGAK
jgi:hypothetical protein